MVAGLAARSLVTNQLMARVASVGTEFRRELHEALREFPLFGEVRGDGLMIGIKLNRMTNPGLNFEHFGFPYLDEMASTSPLLCQKLYKRGFFAFTCGHDWSVLRLQPRFEIPLEKLLAFALALREETDYLASLE